MRRKRGEKVPFLLVYALFLLTMAETTVQGARIEVSLPRLHKVLQSTLHDEIGGHADIFERSLLHQWDAFRTGGVSQRAPFVACGRPTRENTVALQKAAGNGKAVKPLYAMRDDAACHLLHLDQAGADAVSATLEASGGHLIPLPHLAKLSPELAITSNAEDAQPRKGGGRVLEEGVPLARLLIDKIDKRTAGGIEIFFGEDGWTDASMTGTVQTWLEELDDHEKAADVVRHRHFWGDSHRRAQEISENNEAGVHVEAADNSDVNNISGGDIWKTHEMEQRNRWRGLLDRFTEQKVQADSTVTEPLCRFGSLKVDVSARGLLAIIGGDLASLDPVCITVLVAYIAVQPEAVRLAVRHKAFVTSNRDAAWVTQSGATNYFPMWAQGLQGDGEVLAMADTGVDRYQCMFAESDGSAPVATSSYFSPINDPSRRKIIQYIAFSDTSDVYEGHGTHVAGTLVGAMPNTKAGDTDYDGGAFQGKLAVFDFGDSTGALSLPTDLYNQMMEPAFNAEARIHSNSWGSPTPNYQSLGHQIDDFMNTYKTFLVVVAAGNCGDVSGTEFEYSSDCSGATGSHVLSPAQAKNVLGVGAGINGNQLATTGYDIDAVAYFSSRGPTPENRIKPDIIAPGETLSSASASGLAAKATCNYVEKQGTSMATPAAAASAALVRQYFREGWHADGATPNPLEAFEPSNSLLKAILINSARPMTVLQGTSFFTGGRRGLNEETPLELRTCRMPQGWSYWWEADDELNKIGVCELRDAEAVSEISKTVPEQIAEVVQAGESTHDTRKLTEDSSAGSPPDGTQGFGRIALSYGVNINGTVGLFFKDWVEIAQGQTMTYNVTILPSATTSKDLSVTLVWTDPASQSGSAKPVLHDLDLRMKLDGTDLWTYPNGLLTTDTDNNVEKIVINPTIAGGVYIIEVSAPVVTESDTQVFSLAGAGEFIVTNAAPVTPKYSKSVDKSESIFSGVGIQFTWKTGLIFAITALLFFIVLSTCRSCFRSQHKSKGRRRAMPALVPARPAADPYPLRHGPNSPMRSPRDHFPPADTSPYEMDLRSERAAALLAAQPGYSGSTHSRPTGMAQTTRTSVYREHCMECTEVFTDIIRLVAHVQKVHGGRTRKPCPSDGEIASALQRLIEVGPTTNGRPQGNSYKNLMRWWG